jgi:hypothetical protein
MTSRRSGVSPDRLGPWVLEAMARIIFSFVVFFIAIPMHATVHVVASRARFGDVNIRAAEKMLTATRRLCISSGL